MKVARLQREARHDVFRVQRLALPWRRRAMCMALRTEWILHCLDRRQKKVAAEAAYAALITLESAASPSGACAADKNVEQ